MYKASKVVSSITPLKIKPITRLGPMQNMELILLRLVSGLRSKAKKLNVFLAYDGLEVECN